MSGETKLSQVVLPDGTIVDRDGLIADGVWMENDGRGPMGFYDRVHMATAEGEKIYPAHFCRGFTILIEDT